MKSLFATDVNTKEFYGQEFIIRKTDSELSRKSDESIDTLLAYQKKSGMPLWYLIVEYIVFFAAVICLSGFATGCIDNGFVITYQRGAAILYIGAIGLVGWLVMFIFQKVRFKKVAQSPEVNALLGEMNELNNRIKKSLLVPENCVDVDVLCRPFKLKNGKEKRGNAFFNFFNFSFWVFNEGENLCFSDTDCVYGIPISSITDIVLIKKSVMVPQWNKDESIKDPKYKKYAKINNNGTYKIKSHYSVRFNHNGEEWEVLIPMYDIDVISKLTGKSLAI